MMTACIRWASTALLVLIALATIKMLLELGARIQFELVGPLNGDAAVYLTIGRGILNGLTPYIDLFDIKPPGIFLLSSLALLLSDSTGGAHILAASAALAVPIAFLVFAFHRTHPLPLIKQSTLVLVAFLFGASLAVYTVARAGGFQTEAFGAVAGLLYILVIAWSEEPPGRLRIGLAAILILLTVGLKEPFLLTLLAGAIFLSPTVKFFGRAFIVPLVIAVFIGVALLAFLGLLTSYVTLYLPEIVFVRLEQPGFPLWFRSLYTYAPYSNLGFYSPLPWLLIPILTLFYLNPFCKGAEPSRDSLLRQSSAQVLRTALAFVTSIPFTAHVFVWVLVTLSNAYFYNMMTILKGPGSGSYLFLLFFILFISLQLVLFLLFFQEKKYLFAHISANNVAAYCVMLAVASGSFLPQHYIFAVPAYAALFFAFFAMWIRGTSRDCWGRGVALLIVLIILAAPRFHLQEQLRRAEPVLAAEQAGIKEASVMDALMDACGISRYLFIGSNGPVHLTKHSPLGPAIFTVVHNPFFLQKFEDHLNTASLIIYDKDYVRKNLPGFFTKFPDVDPPPCAKPFLPLPTLGAYIRAR